MKKTVPLIEVSLVVGLFFVLRLALKNSDLADWQQSVFGAAPVSSSLLFFVLPMAFVLATGRNPGAAGLTTQRLRYHGRVALRALAVVAPATVLFPLVQWLGFAPMQWPGATILAVGFAAAGVAMVRVVGGLGNQPAGTIGVRGLLGYVVLLVGATALVALLKPASELGARIVLALIFTGFLEELLFRGYLQSRLNDSFGRPFRVRGVRFGAGLPIAAAAFGLAHPLTALGDPTPWPWALWTATMGLIFGFLREKTGAAVTPAIVHGVILVPGVLFGSVGQ